MTWHDRALVAMAFALVLLLALIVFSDHPKPAPAQQPCVTRQMHVVIEGGPTGDVTEKCP